MSVDTKVTFDQEYVKQFSDGRSEPSWLQEQRVKALEIVDTVEMPKPEKTNISKWNFTQFQHDLKPVDKKSSVKELDAGIQELLDESAEESNLLIQQDGSVIYEDISDRLGESGVIFTDIETAATKHGDLLQKYFMKDVEVDANRLNALHVALMNGGTFIYVPKNVEVDVPLQTILWNKEKDVGLLHHVIIVAEDNSSVTYLENNASASEEGSSVINIVAEVYAGPGAKVSFGAVDRFAKDVTTYVNRRGYVEKDGKIEWALGQMNDGNTVSENVTYLIGDGSYTDTKTVSIGSGDQNQDFVARIMHEGKHSEGYILTHGVMKDTASSIFNGITKIEHGASKSHGEQTERVLMLSEKARGDANPILLIDEDDVTAGHAASVGKVDPMQMYYMMSRGLPKEEAERLIIHGFLAPVVDQLPIEAVKKQLTGVIERKVK